MEHATPFAFFSAIFPKDCISNAIISPL